MVSAELMRVCMLRAVNSVLPYEVIYFLMDTFLRSTMESTALDFPGNTKLFGKQSSDSQFRMLLWSRHCF